MKTNTTQKTLSCYIRVSKKNEEDQSIESQEEDAIRKAKSLKMGYKLYRDNGISAYRDDNLKFRPQFMQLLQDIKDGLITDIYCNDPSRLSRNEVTNTLIFSAVKKANIIIHYFDSKVDLNNPSDKLFNTIKGGFVDYETEIRKQRFELGMRSANKNGKYLGPNCPYGYEKTKSEDKTKRGILIVNKEESKIYLEIVKQYIGGNGSDTLAKRLNSRNVPTRSMTQGKDIKWNSGTILSMLKNPLYYGKRIYGGEEVDCPQLLDKKTWDKIQAIRKQNKIHSQKKGSVHFYLLKGLIKCGYCGRNFYGKIKESSKERLYCCLSTRNNYKKCANKSINIDRIEAKIWLILWSTKKYTETYIKNYNNENKVESLQEELTELNKLLKGKEKAFKAILGRIDTAISKTAKNALNESSVQKEKEMIQLEKDITRLKSKLNSISANTVNLKLENIGIDFLKNDEDRKQLVNQVIKEIRITHDKKKQEHTVVVIPNEKEMFGTYPHFTFKVSSKLLRAKELESINFIYKTKTEQEVAEKEYNRTTAEKFVEEHGSMSFEEALSYDAPFRIL